VIRQKAFFALLVAVTIAGCSGSPPRPAVAPSPGSAEVPGLSEGEIVEVEAVGEANVIEGNKLATRQVSLSAAQKAAVEKAVGVLVTGQMVVSKARLIEDEIFSKTAGYLKSWEVLGEEEEGGIYRTRIKARVKLGDVRKDVDGLGLLIKTKKVGNPRVMVLIEESVDGQPSRAKTVETALAKQLLEKGYKVVDADQLAEIARQEDVVRAVRGDAEAAAELGRRFGAEVALVGTASAKFFTDQGLAGMIAYRGVLALKAVKTSSGQMVLADTREGSGMELSREMAAVRCLSGMADVSGADFAEKLAPALWEGAELQYAVAGVRDFDALQALIKAVRAVDGVSSVTARTFAAGEAVLDVELSHGDAATFAAGAEKSKAVRVSIKEVAAYRVAAEIVSEEVVR